MDVGGSFSILRSAQVRAPLRDRGGLLQLLRVRADEIGHGRHLRGALRRVHVRQSRYVAGVPGAVRRVHLG